MSAARLLGLQGCLSRPLWGGMGILSIFGGILASNRWQWDIQSLLTLVLVLLLAGLGWGTLWNLAVGQPWLQSLSGSWPPEHPAALPVLPYTRPDSPGGRLARGLNRAVGWWRASLGPAQSQILVGLLTAAVLTVLLTLALPARLLPLNALVVALIGLGIVQRWRGASPLASQAILQVGLGWLAGHLAFAEMTVASWSVALALVLAVLGGLRVSAGLGGGVWLLNGGQVAIIAMLVAFRQPVAVAAAGLFLLGQILLQPALWLGADLARTRARASLGHRLWPWLSGVMLVAALVVP